MPADLTNQNISLTYKGLLHAQGNLLPSSGQVIIADGAGQYSSLSVGVTGQGITVTGDINATSIGTEYGTIESLTLSSAVAQSYITAPNTAKAWVVFSGNDGTMRAGYNIATVVRNTAGDYSLTFINDMTSADYVVHTNISYDNTTPYMVCSHVKAQPAPATTGFGLRTYRLVGSTPTQFDAATVSVVVYHL